MTEREPSSVLVGLNDATWSLVQKKSKKKKKSVCPLWRGITSIFCSLHWWTFLSFVTVRDMKYVVSAWKTKADHIFHSAIHFLSFTISYKLTHLLLTCAFQSACSVVCDWFCAWSRRVKCLGFFFYAIESFAHVLIMWKNILNYSC